MINRIKRIYDVTNYDVATCHFIFVITVDSKHFFCQWNSFYTAYISSEIKTQCKVFVDPFFFATNVKNIG